MEDSKIVICRLCLNFTTFDECQVLDAVSRDMLKFIVPEVDLDISQDPKICQTCYKTVLRCYRFKSNCNKDTRTEIKKNSEESDSISIEIDDVENKCNFCLNSRDDEDVEEFNDRKTYFTEVLQKCLSEWNLSSKTIPCKKCLDILTSQFTFIGNCVDTEDKLKHYRLTHGTNSKGKLNLYEAVQHILSKESRDLDVMIKADQEIPFPELVVNTDTLKMEEVDIKSEAMDEDYSEFEEEAGSSGSEKQHGISKLKHEIDEAECSSSRKKFCGDTSQDNPYVAKIDSTENDKELCKDTSLVEYFIENDRNRIRRIVHSFYLKHEIPTLEKIRVAVMEDRQLPSLTNVFLTRTLNKINFRTRGKRCSKFLKERDETIICRRRYLTQIQAFRKEERPIYYVDEMFIHLGKEPSSTSFSVLHIGNEDGFLEDGLLLLQTKKPDDCNSKFKITEFERWFSKILPKLKDNAVIVLHNSPWHSRLLELYPTASTHKVDVQKWLLSKGIAFEEDMVKLELLDLVKKAKLPMKRYAVDEIAKANNKMVLRLPPYHHELSPLKLIWPKIKSEFVSKDFACTTGFKEVWNCLADAVARVSKEDWKNAMEEVLPIEKEMWQLDINMETLLEPLLVDCSSTESESDSE